MIDTLIQLGVQDRAMLAAARRRVGGERPLTVRLLELARRYSTGAVVLSTCERLEIYALARAEGAGTLAGDMAMLIGPDQNEAPLCRRVGGAAAGHLFRVAAGLESRLIGEPHVLGQVSRAATVDFVGGISDPCLARLFQAAVAFGRCVRSQTDLGRMAVSCVDATIAELVGRLSMHAHIAVLGSGTLAGDLVHRLSAVGYTQVTVLARHPEHAVERFGHHCTSVDAIDRLSKRLDEFDAVIAATSAGEYLLAPPDLRVRERPLMLIDLGVPPNIDPAARHERFIVLVGLDDMSIDRSAIRATIEQASTLAAAAAARWSRRWLNTECVRIASDLASREQFQTLQRSVVA